jgi:hypothetical protein
MRSLVNYKDPNFNGWILGKALANYYASDNDFTFYPKNWEQIFTYSSYSP